VPHGGCFEQYQLHHLALTESKLEKYIEIPSQSPAFDAEWETNGLLDKTVSLFTEWVKSRCAKAAELLQ